MAARRPFWNFLLPPFWEYYWSDLNQTLHTSSPYDLVVQHAIFSSFAYSIWPPSGGLVFGQNFLLPLLWENYWSDLNQTLHTGSPFFCSCVTYFFFVHVFNMATRRSFWNFLLPPFWEYYWSDLNQTLHTSPPYGVVQGAKLAWVR